MQFDVIHEPLPDSDIYRIEDNPNRGRGCFATSAITANSHILTTDAPLVHVIFRKYKKEVCAQCFKYDRGRTLPFSYVNAHPTSSKQEVKLAWFCSESCFKMWCDDNDGAACRAITALELFSRDYKPSKLEDVVLERLHLNLPGKIAHLSDVDTAWRAAESTAEKIREARHVNQAGKQHRKLIQAQTELLKKDPFLDLDMASYFLQGTLTRYKSAEAWQTIYSLVPSIIVYQTEPDGLRVLTSHCLAYLLLQLVLPQELLPFCDQNSIRTLIARESTNAFGLWEESGDEYLGYGVWVKASLFNHSCNPNIAKGRVDRSRIFEAARDIVAGEELCISYLGAKGELKMPVHARREALLRTWGFLCLCSRCAAESGAHTTS